MEKKKSCYLKRLVACVGVVLLVLTNAFPVTAKADETNREGEAVVADTGELAATEGEEIENDAHLFAEFPDQGLTDSLSSKVVYSANYAKFKKDTLYQGMLQVTNSEESAIDAGLEIVVAIPKEVVVNKTVDLSETTKELFEVTVEADRVVFKLKKQIVAELDVKLIISGTIIGESEQSYPVSVTVQANGGQVPEVANQNMQITMEKEDKPAFYYGMLNMYWGSLGNESSFIGKDSDAINGLPTGVFSSTKDEITNFIEINPQGRSGILSDSDHYELSYTISAAYGVGKIKSFDQANFKIIDETAGNKVLDSSCYSIEWKPDNAGFSLILKSFDASDGAVYPSQKLVINLKFTATTEGEVYRTDSDLVIKTAEGETKGKPETFPLNNIFQKGGEIKVFPSIELSDQSYFAGELTEATLLATLKKNVKIYDPTVGVGELEEAVDLTLLEVSLTQAGSYKVQFVVTNKQGNSAVRWMTVTIKNPTVKINYKNEAGDVLVGSEIIEGVVGASYHQKLLANIAIFEKTPQFANYTLINQASSDLRGDFVKGEIEVDLLYALPIKVQGSVTWQDEENKNKVRPDFVTINLFANNKPVKQVTLTSADSWNYEFNNLPKYQNGERIIYTVTENQLANYTTTINGFEIENKYAPSAAPKEQEQVVIPEIVTPVEKPKPPVTPTTPEEPEAPKQPETPKQPDIPEKSDDSEKLQDAKEQELPTETSRNVSENAVVQANRNNASLTNQKKGNSVLPKTSEHLDSSFMVTGFVFLGLMLFLSRRKVERE